MSTTVRREIGAVRIVPPTPTSIGIQKAHGTQVLMPDGTPIPRVYKVEMVVEVDNVWRAVIHCHAQAEEIPAVGTIVVSQRVPWWRRVVDWIAGRPNERDITTLTSVARQFERAR